MGLSPFVSTPFWVKLPIAIIVDLIAAAAEIVSIGYFLTVVGIPISIATHAAGWVLTMLYLIFFHNFSVFFILPAGIASIQPALALLPFATIATIWNGYKTGWRH